MATSFPELSPTRQREPGNEVARMGVIKSIRNRGREISKREEAKISKIQN